MGDLYGPPCSSLVQPFAWRRLTRVAWAGWRAAGGKIKINGMPSHLNYCVIFIVVTQFTNVASGRIILPGGPLVGDPYSSSIAFCGEDKTLLL